MASAARPPRSSCPIPIPSRWPVTTRPASIELPIPMPSRHIRGAGSPRGQEAGGCGCYSCPSPWPTRQASCSHNRSSPQSDLAIARPRCDRDGSPVGDGDRYRLDRLPMRGPTVMRRQPLVAYRLRQPLLRRPAHSANGCWPLTAVGSDPRLAPDQQVHENALRGNIRRRACRISDDVFGGPRY